MSKKELADELLEEIAGGQITYTWDGSIGSIGINGNNPFLLVNKEKFLSFYNENKETMSEATILSNLLAQGVIKKP